MGLDNDDIKALIAILQKGLQNEDDSDEVPVKKTRRKSKSSKPKIKKQSKLLSLKNEIAASKAYNMVQPRPNHQMPNHQIESFLEPI